MSLLESSLSTLSRLELGKLMIDYVREELGSDAGLELDDPAWAVAAPGRGGTERRRLQGFGVLSAPRGSKRTSDVARVLQARLADFVTIEEARQRAARLESLYEAAQSFTAELDLDRSLALIVTSGRELTGADICYLSLNDFERGETYIRCTAGTTTPAFDHVRLKYGEGLGGLVAKEGRPYYSPDYLNDERFVHVVDPEVEGEGVVAVAGVPVRIPERVIGVLFIANRYSSTFEDDDITFMQALADYAAVAIENARLYGLLDHAARLHARLTDVLLSEQPQAALEAAIGDAVGLPVRIRPMTAGDVADQEAHVTLVRAGPTQLGRLVVESGEVTALQRTALEQAARVVAVQLLKERAIMQARLRTRGELVDAILTDAQLSDDEITQRAAAFGLDLTAVHRAVVYAGDRANELAHRVPDAFVASRLGDTVALLSPESDAPAIGLFALGGPAGGRAGIARSVIEATRVLEVAELLNHPEGPVSSRDVGVYGMLLDRRRAHEVVEQSRSLLSPILDYDAEHGAVMLPTLESYLDAQGSSTQAARDLHVHVNSVYYRLGRIRELTGWDLDDADTRLHLQLACRLLRLAT